jgi:hypothetical protein
MSEKIVILSDRIKELSRTTGTTPFTLNGAATGFSAFGDFYASGDSVFYAATDGSAYEVGSGQYLTDGVENTLTRFPLRSSNLNSGPYYINATSNAGATAGTAGYFYPLWLTESSAVSGDGITSAHEHTFTEFPGTTFYMPDNHEAHGEAAPLSGVDYNASGLPVDFGDGVKEVYVTYPGKYSVFTGFGLEGFSEPRVSGLAFWGSEQLLNYDSNVVWSDSGNRLGLTQSDPQYALDVGGLPSYSLVRASGFIDGGSGIMFSGVAGSYSGGQQLEPFFRNELDTQTGTDLVFSLSGLVDQRLLFAKQPEGFVFAGPASGSCGGTCADNYPTFRYLHINDLPELPYIAQFNDADPNQDGAIAIYKESGVIKYDNAFVIKDDTDRLGVNTASPNATLDVFGDVAISGNLNTTLVCDSGIEFSSTHIKIGSISGDFPDWSYSASIGHEAGSGASLITYGDLLGYRAGYFSREHQYTVMLGTTAGMNATGSYQSNMIGWAAGFQTSGTTRSSMIGPWAGYAASGISDSSFIGFDAGRYADNIEKSDFIGHRAGAYASGYKQSVVIGEFAGISGIGNRQCNFIGHRAGENYESTAPYDYARGDLEGCNFIGTSAGRYAYSGVKFSNVFGYSAGERASGQYNTYIGFYAGYQVSGNNNIDIVSHYVNVSAGHEPVNGRLTILADRSDGKTSVSDKLNIGNTIAGDVLSRRIAIGLLTSTNLTPRATLEIVPSGGSDIGVIVSGHIGHTANLFEAHSGDATILANITPDGSIHTSGTVRASGGLFLDPAADPQSTTSVLWNDGGTLKFGTDTVDTATASTFKMNDGTATDDTITNGQVVTISGVSGVVTNYTAGDNLFRISAEGVSGDVTAVSGWAASTITNLPGGYSNWKLTDGTLGGDDISSTNLVIISGVSGVTVDYTAAAKHIRVSAKGLSGVLQTQIDALGAGGVTVGSGLIVNDSKIYMDYQGSGQLEHLRFNRDQIRIGTDAGATFDVLDSGSHWTAIGYEAGWGASGNDYSDMIGYHAGYKSSGNDISVMIGKSAGATSTGCSQSNMIGHAAGSGARETTLTNFMGYYAGRGAIGCSESDMIGSLAGYSSSGCATSTMMGYWAGLSSKGNSRSVMIGYQAASTSAFSSDAVMIGNSAGSTSTGVDGTNIIGWTAGHSASGSIYSNFMGVRAGSEAYGCNHSNILGFYAGYQASGADASNMFGYYAGASTTGCSGVNMLGSGAGTLASDVRYSNILGTNAGSGVIGSFENDLIGYQAGAESKDSNRLVAIGSYAAKDASGCHLSNIIGLEAGFGASGSTYSNFMGNLAGYGANNCDYVDAIGYGAAYRSSGVENSVLLGRIAGYESQTSVGMNIIGHSAGFRASGCNESIMIGSAAGKDASGCVYTTMMGYYAGWKTYNCDQTIIIGGFAGYRATDSENSIMIGHYAGYDAYNSDYSTYLGYYAGYERQGSHNLILKTNSTASDGGASWATSTQDYIIDIAGIINGMSQDAGTTPVIRELRLGKPPSSAGDLSNVCTSIMPVSPADVTLKLDRATSQTASLLQSVNAGGATIDIVDKDGYLKIPVGVYLDPTDKSLHSASPASTANEITKSDGRIAVYNISGEEYILVCIGSTWYRTNEQLTAL